MISKKTKNIIMITSSIIILDHLTKYISLKYISQPIGNSLFSFTFVKNEGIAFGIEINKYFMNISSIIIILGIIYFIFKKSKDMDYIFLSFVLGGAIGNIIDRIFRGFVIDFISIYTFPVFNIADSFISIGVLLWIFTDIKNQKTIK